MSAKKIMLFKINNEVVLSKDANSLYLNQVDELIWDLALAYNVAYSQVDVETVDVFDGAELSDDVDVSIDGLVFWRAEYPNTIQGIRCTLKEGTDEYLDALLDGTLDDHVEFFI